MEYIKRNSNEYEAASEAFNVVSRRYSAVVEAYRARRVDDYVFLAARRELDSALRAFDEAEARENARDAAK